MDDAEHPVGLGAIRSLLLTGFRRMQVPGLQQAWIKRSDHAIHFPDAKGAEQIRVIGEAAMNCIESQPGREGSP